LSDIQPSAARETREVPQGKLPLLALSALGIVFGDIGTSPLYTFKTILGTAAHPSDPATVLGALSLVLWTLFIITTVKYVSFAMRVDNDGEGGILALMALLGVKKQQRPTIVAVGLFGAALFAIAGPTLHLGAFATFVVFAWRDEDEELIPADEVARIDRDHLAQRHAMRAAGS